VKVRLKGGYGEAGVIMGWSGSTEGALGGGSAVDQNKYYNQHLWLDVITKTAPKILDRRVVAVDHFANLIRGSTIRKPALKQTEPDPQRFWAKKSRNNRFSA